VTNEIADRRHLLFMLQRFFMLQRSAQAKRGNRTTCARYRMPYAVRV
jgi:hypothetical protein